MADEYSEEIQEKIIAEEYKVWKKNAPFLYDVVLTHPLEWPSLTVQWLPGREVDPSGEYAEHKIILGTHTSGGEDNHLCLATVKLPTEDAQLDARKYDEEKGELGGYGGSGAKVEIKVRMNHDKEVNRARYCPQDPFLIATKSPSSDVLVFNYARHPNVPKDREVRPELRLKGHAKEGYGLSWSHVEKGRLVSAGDDNLVCMWEVAAALDGQGAGDAAAVAAGAPVGGSSTAKAAGGSITREVQASRTFTGHKDVVEDVSWHRFHKDVFASCGDDRLVALWDVRDGSTATPKLRIANAHKDNVMSLAFNPYQEFLLLTGSVDRSVKLWDTRSVSKPLATFTGHAEEVLNVAWAPFQESVFASSSADRRVFVWDLSRIGQEQSEEDAEDGPPELMFVHGGHTSKISDFGWCETEDWFVASVAEDNILQVWQPAESIWAGEGNDEEEGDAAASGKAGDDDLE